MRAAIVVAALVIGGAMMGSMELKIGIELGTFIGVLLLMDLVEIFRRL